MGKDWCWSWNSNTLATWCEELTHWKRPWCWERLRAGEGDDRGWDGMRCMASLTQWTWVWVNSGSWWWTGRPGMLQSMGLQKVGHDWETELNWTVLKLVKSTSKAAARKSLGSGGPDDLADKFRYLKNTGQDKHNVFCSLHLVPELASDEWCPNHVSSIPRSHLFILSSQVFLLFQEDRPYLFPLCLNWDGFFFFTKTKKKPTQIYINKSCWCYCCC